MAKRSPSSTPETQNATLSLVRTANQLMLELWPGDPFCGAWWRNRVVLFALAAAAAAVASVHLLNNPVPCDQESHSVRGFLYGR